MSAEVEAVVLRLHGRDVHADAGGRELRCVLAGRVKRGPREARSPVSVGDRVMLDASQEPAVVTRVLKRRSELCRADNLNPRKRKILAANVDAMFCVVCADLLPDLLMPLDRLLLAAQMQNLSALLVVNKCELVPPELISEALEGYGEAVAPTLLTSARTGQGLDELRARIAGRAVVLAGPSGVGKSSLLNAIEPGLKLRVGDVDRHGEGRHTTTHASLVRAAGGYVVDTPGVRDFRLWGFNLHELALFYPDFAPFRDGCRFTGCTHRHEPRCAVKQAVAEGALDAGRYERYLAILREQWNDESRAGY